MVGIWISKLQGLNAILNGCRFCKLWVSMKQVWPVLLYDVPNFTSNATSDQWQTLLCNHWLSFDASAFRIFY
jgi:hypothetical protein